MARFAQYTGKKLLSVATDKDGENRFHQIGRLKVVTTSERVEEPKRRYGHATSWGLDTRLRTAEQ